MRFPGKKNLAFALILSILCGNLPGFGASLTAVNLVNGLNLNLNGDHGLYPSLKGVILNPRDPFKMEFILDTSGNAMPSKAEVSTVVSYFLAALTLPEEELWVNLAPYEPDRIIAHDLSVTQMGETLLAQDYLLKQLSAALTFPEQEPGKSYWNAIQGRDAIYRVRGNNNFNKVWITPKAALVREGDHSAYIESASLQVLTDVDYVAAQQNGIGAGSNAFKTYILPQVEETVNHARAFAPLRQVYSAFIMATWFKQKLKQSIFTAYIDQKKTTGIDTVDKQVCDRLYRQYLTAFAQGAYNYIKSERVVPRFIASGTKISRRRYFSGGVMLRRDKVTFAPELAIPQGPRALVEFKALDYKSGAFKHITQRDMPQPSNELKEKWGARAAQESFSHVSFSDNVFTCKMIYDSEGEPLPDGVPSYHWGDGHGLVIVLRRELKDPKMAKNRLEAINHEFCEHYIETIDSPEFGPYALAVKMRVSAFLNNFFKKRQINPDKEYLIKLREINAGAIKAHKISKITFVHTDFVHYPALEEYVLDHLDELTEICEISAPRLALQIKHIWASAYMAVKHMQSNQAGITGLHAEEIANCDFESGVRILDEKRDVHDAVVKYFLKGSGMFSDPALAFDLYNAYNARFQDILTVALLDKIPHKDKTILPIIPGGNAFKHVVDKEMATPSDRVRGLWIKMAGQEEVKNVGSGRYIMPAKIIKDCPAASIPGGAPSYHFRDNGILIIVVSHDIADPRAFEEAVNHEVYEAWFEPIVLNDLIHKNIFSPELAALFHEYEDRINGARINELILLQDLVLSGVESVSAVEQNFLYEYNDFYQKVMVRVLPEAKRQAHILASALCGKEFGKDGHATLLHAREIDKFMAPGQAQSLLEEDRSEHYRTIAQYLPGLLMDAKAYDSIFRDELRKIVLSQEEFCALYNRPGDKAVFREKRGDNEGSATTAHDLAQRLTYLGRLSRSDGMPKDIIGVNRDYFIYREACLRGDQGLRGIITKLEELGSMNIAGLTGEAIVRFMYQSKTWFPQENSYVAGEKRPIGRSYKHIFDSTPMWDLDESIAGEMLSWSRGKNDYEAFSNKKIKVLSAKDEIKIPGGMPSVGFWDDAEKILVVIMRKDIYANKAMHAEALEHEYLEYLLFPGAAQDAVKMVASIVAEQDFNPAQEAQKKDYEVLRDEIIRYLNACLEGKDTGEFPFVMNKSELLTNLMRDPEQVILILAKRNAHILATGRCIANNFDGRSLLLIHIQELSMMTWPFAREWKDENRGYHVALYKRFPGLFNPGELKKIMLYEGLFRRHLSLIKPNPADEVSSGKYNPMMDDSPMAKEGCLKASWDLAYKLIETLDTFHTAAERAAAGKREDLSINFPVNTRDGYVLHYIMNQFMGGNPDSEEYGDEVEVLVHKLFLLRNMNISSLSGKGVIRLLQDLGLLPGKQSLPAEVTFAIRNYKPMGKNNRPVITGEFIQAYETYAGENKGDRDLVEPRSFSKDSFSRNAVIVEALDDHPVPDGVPSVSFLSGETLIIVLKKGLLKEILPGDAVSEREEAIEHERYEDYFKANLEAALPLKGGLQGQERSESILRMAHILANAYLINRYSIVKFGKRGLLPLHRKDIASMDPGYAAGLIDEKRQEQHGWIDIYLGRSVARNVADYDNTVVKSALQSRAAVGGIKILSQNIRVTGKSAGFNLSPEILQELQRSRGMDFTVEAVIPAPLN
jgi:hypothetical protein